MEVLLVHAEACINGARLSGYLASMKPYCLLLPSISSLDTLSDQPNYESTSNKMKGHRWHVRCRFSFSVNCGSWKVWVLTNLFVQVIGRRIMMEHTDYSRPQSRQETIIGKCGCGRFVGKRSLSCVLQRGLTRTGCFWFTSSLTSIKMMNWK